MPETNPCLQNRVKEFGLNPSTLVGFTSDGASVMVAAGRELGVLHQICLGIYCANNLF